MSSELRPGAAAPAGGAALPMQAVLFPTCLVELVAPQVRDAAAAALGAVGYDVRATAVTCCGQPAFSAGHLGAARRVARASLRALDDTEGDVVVLAGSCAAMVRLHWPELFHGDRDEARALRVASRALETSQALAPHVETLRSRGLRWRGRVGFHDSCHLLRELRVQEAPRSVLGSVGELDVVALAHGERCCGFGGLFSVRYPALSVAMADTKLDEAVDLGLDGLVSCDGGCLMHLGGRAAARGDGPRTLHLVELLVEAGISGSTARREPS